MGVTMYLTAATVMRTLRSIADLAPGSSVCFDSPQATHARATRASRGTSASTRVQHC
jgi:O-methyltransferase involved in polyketide biosynthesis